MRQNTHKFCQYHALSQLKKDNVFSCVMIHFEDREKIASSIRSYKRRQVSAVSVNFKEDTSSSGDLINEVPPTVGTEEGQSHICA